MKLALFSDVHSNLPALEACLESIDATRPDAVYCLGDLVGYNIWPNEVVRKVVERRIPVIAGNYDFGIGRNSDDCGCAYKTDEEKALGVKSIAFTNQVVEPDVREYLRDLPSHIRLEYQLNGEKFNLLLVHGSPRKVNEYLFEDREAQSLLRIMEQADADLMFFGHTHKPYHRKIEDGSGKYRHAVNIGSVGKPKDGDPRGCYVMVTIDSTFSMTDPDSLKVEFLRFEYDVSRAAKAIEESPLPHEYADMLRKGY